MVNDALLVAGPVLAAGSLLFLLKLWVRVRGSR